MKIAIVVPSLRANGGIRVLLRFAEESVHRPEILVVWRGGELDEQFEGKVRFLTSTHFKSPLNLFAYGLAILKNFTWRRNGQPVKYILTHFTTFPIAIFVKEPIIIAQGVEWLGFKNPILSKIAEHFSLFFYRNETISTVSTSRTVQNQLAGYGVSSTLAQVWANIEFGKYHDTQVPRPYDLVCVVRDVPNKRPDLYLRAVRELQLNTLVITPDASVSTMFAGENVTVIFRPSFAELRDAYRSARVQLHFSDFEGLGLPPLEGMGQGCVPLCRDSGGVRNYLFDDLEYLVLQADFDMTEVKTKFAYIIRNYKHFSDICRHQFSRGANLNFANSLDDVVSKKWPF